MALTRTKRGIAKGGRLLNGAPLGILILEAPYARIHGDLGNATTWPFPVMLRVVPGATPEKVVLKGAEGLLPVFIEQARDLVRLGAEAITTSCGFLSIFQREIAEAVGVPVATSSLLQVPWIQATLPRDKRVGIVTISKPSLTERHLVAAGVDPTTPVIGTEGGKEFFRVIVLGESDDMDIDLAEQDVVDAAKELVARDKSLGALLLECTNMAPYAARVQEETGLPVYDIYSLITWFHAGIRPRRFQ